MVSTLYFHNTQHYNSISSSQKQSESSRRGTVGQGDDYCAKVSEVAQDRRPHDRGPSSLLRERPAVLPGAGKIGIYLRNGRAHAVLLWYKLVNHETDIRR